MITPPNITLPDGLQELVDYCETVCAAGCCGIDAFDFSPLHVASYLARSGPIDLEEVIRWDKMLDEFLEKVIALPADQAGFICSVAGMNQGFTRQQFEAFIEEIRSSVWAAPKVRELSEQLQGRLSKY